MEHQGFGLRILQHFGQLFGSIAKIEVDGAGPKLVGREHGLQMLGRVVRHDRHLGLASEADVRERRREPRGPVIEFGPPQSTLATHDRHTFGQYIGDGFPQSGPVLVHGRAPPLIPAKPRGITLTGVATSDVAKGPAEGVGNGRRCSSAPSAVRRRQPLLRSARCLHAAPATAHGRANSHRGGRQRQGTPPDRRNAEPCRDKSDVRPREQTWGAVRLLSREPERKGPSRAPFRRGADQAGIP